MLDSLKGDERLKDIPVVLLAAKAEDAAATYGDRIKGAISNADDLKPVQEALSAAMTGDRALAEDLAGRAATTLSNLCHAGRCACSPGVLTAVSSALTNRPDSVSAPALGIFGSCGSAEQVPAVVAILADEARGESVRSAAGLALAGILGRDSAAAGRRRAGEGGGRLGLDRARLGARGGRARARAGQDGLGAAGQHPAAAAARHRQAQVSGRSRA